MFSLVSIVADIQGAIAVSPTNKKCSQLVKVIISPALLLIPILRQLSLSSNSVTVDAVHPNSFDG